MKTTIFRCFSLHRGIVQWLAGRLFPKRTLLWIALSAGFVAAQIIQPSANPDSIPTGTAASEMHPRSCESLVTFGHLPGS